MSHSSISLSQLSKLFPDEDGARKYMEGRRWPSGVICPDCQEPKRITPRPKGFYRCLNCRQDFTVRTGTIFERSHVSLDKWILAMYILMTARKGVSSLQLGKDIGVTQKTAWFILRRLREACGNDPSILRGIFAIDETYISGKERNKHGNNKKRAGRGTVGKTPVLGVRERLGRARAKPVLNTSAGTLQATIHEHVVPGSMLHTDDHGGEYVRDGVSTNGIETVWAVLKRGLHGIYYHASPKHLHRYVDEFTLRLNDGDVNRHTLERLASLVTASFGPWITYRELTA